MDTHNETAGREPTERVYGVRFRADTVIEARDEREARNFIQSIAPGSVIEFIKEMSDDFARTLDPREPLPESFVNDRHEAGGHPGVSDGKPGFNEGHRDGPTTEGWGGSNAEGTRDEQAVEPLVDIEDPNLPPRLRDMVRRAYGQSVRKHILKRHGRPTQGVLVRQLLAEAGRPLKAAEIAALLYQRHGIEWTPHNIHTRMCQYVDAGYAKRVSGKRGFFIPA